MILGIVSDTHGRAERLRDAMKILRERGATAFVHCGDLGGEAVITELATGAMDEFGHPRAWFVWGNTDPREPLLDAHAKNLGLPLPPRFPPLRIELGDRRIAVFHGHEREFERLVRSLEQRPDELADPKNAPEFVLYGHTHIAADDTFGKTRLINPGALHRAAKFTAALLDLKTGELIYLEVN